jgi:hypothetical protein
LYIFLKTKTLANFLKSKKSKNQKSKSKQPLCLLI